MRRKRETDQVIVCAYIFCICRCFFNINWKQRTHNKKKTERKTRNWKPPRCRQDGPPKSPTRCCVTGIPFVTASLSDAMRGPIVARYIHTGAFYEIHNRTEISNQKSQSSARKSPVWQSYKIWKLVFFLFYFSFFFVFSLPFPPVFLSVSISSDSECCSRARVCPPDCPSKYLSLALLKTINPKRWPFRREPSEQQKPIDCCLALEPSWIFDTKCSLFMDSKVNKSSLYELATWNKFDHYPR